MITRNTIAQYIKAADYPALVEVAAQNQAKTLKYIQSYIYGDYDDPIRWQAITAFGYLAHTYADEYDEAYRNVLRRSLWAMNDESGNVPWSAPEVMAAIIKAAPKYDYDFTAPMLTNGLDNPMCHIGVMWAIGHLGNDFAKSIAPFLARLDFALNMADPTLCGYAIWAYTQTNYSQARELITPLLTEKQSILLYDGQCLKDITIAELVQEYLQGVSSHV